MLTANLGVALHRLGWRVLVLDLDPQNALRLHFEVSGDTSRGIADEVPTGRDWSELVIETPAGVFLIPFGSVSGAQSRAALAYAAGHPGWIGRQLASFLDHEDLMVVIDTPAGASAFLPEVEAIADLRLAPLLGDAMSLSIVPQIRNGEFFQPAPPRNGARTGYVLNQIDRRRHLCRDVLALSEDVLGDDLYGIVRLDEAVAEAVACKLTVLDYAPDSAASGDIAQLAREVDRTLRPSA